MNISYLIYNDLLVLLARAEWLNSSVHQTEWKIEIKHH